MRRVGNAFIRVWEHFFALFLPPKGFLFEPNGPFFSITIPPDALIAFAKNHHYFSKHPLIGKVTNDSIDKIQALLYEMQEATEHAVAEVLTKVLAYRNLTEGATIEIPRNGIFRTYKVDQVFDLWQHIPAFGLTCENAPPILLFRGTQFSPFVQSGRASIAADLDPKGPGFDLYEHARPKIVEWLKKQTERAQTMGYSLGGALASYALILDSQYFSQTAKSYLFHNPGVPRELLQQFEEMDEPPACQAFACFGDLVSKIGNLFGRTTILRLKKVLPPITAHTSLLFAMPDLQKAEVHNRKENRCEFRHHYTIIHRSTSRLCYPIVRKLFLKK
ncbi:MAG: hypothetical protein ChlgKO_09330 [Chlamydiales bacterium]